MFIQILELYARCGESLKNNGLMDAVLPIHETAYALDLFVQNHLLVLGGDLYTKNESGNFESFYADWFYDGLDRVDSVQTARDYLSQFATKNIFVSFTLKQV